MPDDSDESYIAFAKDSRAKWIKLDPEDQQQLKDNFSDFDKVLGKSLYNTANENLIPADKKTSEKVDDKFTKALRALSPERQKIYNEYLNNAKTEDEHLRATARMHKNDPDLYDILYLGFTHVVDSYKLSDEAREGLLYVS